MASFGIDVVLVKEINARERLREAGYFLEGMKRLEREGSVDEFIYHFDGFLVAWHSIHNNTILYDFAEEFKLPFTRRERMTDYEFGLAAKWLGRRDALAFLKWLNGEVGKLKSEYGVLFDFRQQVVHRSGRRVEKKTEYRETAYSFVSTPAVTAVVSGDWVSKLRGLGEVEVYETRSSPRKTDETAVPTPGATGSATTPDAIVRYPEAENLFYFFQTDDPEGRRVVDVCESAYKDIDKMLTEAQIGAWK